MLQQSIYSSLHVLREARGHRSCSIDASLAALRTSCVAGSHFTNLGSRSNGPLLCTVSVSPAMCCASPTLWLSISLCTVLYDLGVHVVETIGN